MEPDAIYCPGDTERSLEDGDRQLSVNSNFLNDVSPICGKDSHIVCMALGWAL